MEEALLRLTIDQARGVCPTKGRAHHDSGRMEADKRCGTTDDKTCPDAVSSAVHPIMADDGIDHRVGACHTTARTTPRFALRRPRDKMSPFAEGEDGDDWRGP